MINSLSRTSLRTSSKTSSGWPPLAPDWRLRWVICCGPSNALCTDIQGAVRVEKPEDWWNQYLHGHAKNRYNWFVVFGHFRRFCVISLFGKIVRAVGAKSAIIREYVIVHLYVCPVCVYFCSCSCLFIYSSICLFSFENDGTEGFKQFQHFRSTDLQNNMFINCFHV